MPSYTLPRETFDLLLDALGEKQKAEAFAKAIESAICAIDEKAKEAITERKEHLKIELKEELKNELVTRELFEERFKSLEKEMNERFNVIDQKFKVVDERFNSMNFKINIIIVLMLIVLTFANPTFVGLIEKLFKL